MLCRHGAGDRSARCSPGGSGGGGELNRGVFLFVFLLKFHLLPARRGGGDWPAQCSPGGRFKEA
jgi:hypothetical protein